MAKAFVAYSVLTLVSVVLLLHVFSMNGTIRELRAELETRFRLTIVLCYGNHTDMARLEVSNITLRDYLHGTTILDLKSLKVVLDPQHNETTLCSISVPVATPDMVTTVVFNSTYVEWFAPQGSSQDRLGVQARAGVGGYWSRTTSIVEDYVWYIKF